MPTLTPQDYRRAGRTAARRRTGRGIVPGATASHATIDFMPAKDSAAIDATVRRESARSRDPGTFRDRAAVARFFAGMELVPPGVVAVSDWHNDAPPGDRPTAADTMSYVAVARIP